MDEKVLCSFETIGAEMHIVSPFSDTQSGITYRVAGFAAQCSCCAMVRHRRRLKFSRKEHKEHTNNGSNSIFVISLLFVAIPYSSGALGVGGRTPALRQKLRDPANASVARSAGSYDCALLITANPLHR
jgi:hypothetical protein